MLTIVEEINSVIYNFVWGIPVLSLLAATGVLMTLLTKGFQFTHLCHWMKNTIGSIFEKHVSGKTEGRGEISQFQALCTALAATVGVGNIAGVATAIASGGPGSIFWMWLAALMGSMTHYSEAVLGIFYRRRNRDGEWTGGAMYYLESGLGGYRGCKGLGRALAVLFSVFTVMASFGIGNASQINTIAINMASAFSVPPLATGLILMALAGLVIVGGIQRIAAVTEKVVPFMVILYLAGSVALLAINSHNILPALSSIFSFACGFRAIGGAAAGVAVKSAVTWGFKRGIFSNEAGLGSAVMVHSASNAKEPVRQGMWGIFEVFADTIVVCSLTALVVLTSGLVDLETGAMLTSAEQSVLVAQAFEGAFGRLGSSFVAIAILLFAFSTVLGWSYYGTKAWEYLFGTRSTILYKGVFVLFIVVGATMTLQLAWDISDTFNGLMAIPNLVGVLSLSPVVVRITRNYISRTFRGSREEPLLSFDPQIQREQAEALAREQKQ